MDTTPLNHTNGSDLTAHGKAIMNQLQDGLAERVTRSLGELDADLPALITDYAFGAVVGRAGLDLKTREMLTVASLLTLGHAEPQLKLQSGAKCRRHAKRAIRNRHSNGGVCGCARLYEWTAHLSRSYNRGLLTRRFS